MKKICKIKIFALIIVCFAFIFGANIMPVSAKTEKVYLGGFPLGFDLCGEGALVVGITEVISEDGIHTPALKSGIKNGDYILSLNGKRIVSADDIDEVLSLYDGKGLIAEILSGGEKHIKNVYPEKDLKGNYKLGILIRDYLSGLGTVTFIRTDGSFCSLGHPICDEEGKMLGVGGGFAYGSVITGIVKGTRGKAGELKGTINRSEILGKVCANTLSGITGVFEKSSVYDDLTMVETGEPKPGFAEIYTTVKGSKPEKYTAAVVKVDANDKQNKNLVIKITDERLISAAGGIVQGMSGSPIVQDGKLVGAVTHVFLNDCTRGYGISLDKMAELAVTYKCYQ